MFVIRFLVLFGLWSLWQATAPLHGQVPVGNEAPRAIRVIFRLLDSHGRYAGEWQMSRFGSDLNGRFKGLVGANIPYGVYDYTISRGGSFSKCPSITGRIRIEHPAQLVVVVPDPDVILCASNDTVAVKAFVNTGRLEPQPLRESLAKPVWVRLSPVFAMGRPIDAEVDQSGVFRIYQRLDGLFSISVISVDQVVYSGSVDFNRSNQPTTDFVIQLTKDISFNQQALKMKSRLEDGNGGTDQ